MTTEEIIRRVKECGQSLINNAESVAGNYRLQTDLNIHISIPVTGDFPTIEVTSRYIPEVSVNNDYCFKIEGSAAPK